jgi:deoxyhypusine synthase
MILRGCGAVQKIYLNNFSMVQELIANKLNKKDKNVIELIRNRILEVAINDEMYNKYNIFAFQTLSTIVISPSNTKSLCLSLGAYKRLNRHHRHLTDLVE